MGLIYRLFKWNPDKREDAIAATSCLGIIVNLLVALAKIIIGALASSIAIISEGINNSADVLTSVLALVGTKLAAKHPDEKHPFGYGRVEYLVSLVIAALILFSGFEVLKGSVELIFEPAELSISYLALIIVAGSAVIKFCLGLYTIKTGKRVGSNSLIGVGVDSRNDAFASVITIASSVIFLVFGLSLDAYAGIIISLLILKAGFDILKDTVSDLLGKSGEEELAARLYKRIRGTDGILSAVDMMLHNYGPDKWSGSVNVEIDHKKSVGEIYDFLHRLQLEIMHEENVTMVFGVYAVDNDHEKAHELRKYISQYVGRYENIKSFHAVYIDEANSKIYCDFIADYKLKDWEAVENEFKAYMKEGYPAYDLELIIETEYV